MSFGPICVGGIAAPIQHIGNYPGLTHAQTRRDTPPREPNLRLFITAVVVADSFPFQTQSSLRRTARFPTFVDSASTYTRFSRSVFNAPPQAMTWSNIALTDFSCRASGLKTL